MVLEFWFLKVLVRGFVSCFERIIKKENDDGAVGLYKYFNRIIFF